MSDTTTEDGWIAVNERLPDTKKPVLIVHEYPHFLVSEDERYSVLTATYWGNGEWNMSNGASVAPTVTHWQPLPPPPPSGTEKGE